METLTLSVSEHVQSTFYQRKYFFQKKAFQKAMKSNVLQPSAPLQPSHLLWWWSTRYSTENADRPLLYKPRPMFLQLFYLERRDFASSVHLLSLHANICFEVIKVFCTNSNCNGKVTLKAVFGPLKCIMWLFPYFHCNCIYFIVLYKKSIGMGGVV